MKLDLQMYKFIRAPLKLVCKENFWGENACRIIKIYVQDIWRRNSFLVLNRAIKIRCFMKSLGRAFKNNVKFIIKFALVISFLTFTYGFSAVIHRSWVILQWIILEARLVRLFYMAILFTFLKISLVCTLTLRVLFNQFNLYIQIVLCISNISN